MGDALVNPIVDPGSGEPEFKRPPVRVAAFVALLPHLPSRRWLARLFVQERLDDHDRLGLSVGEPPGRKLQDGTTCGSCIPGLQKLVANALGPA